MASKRTTALRQSPQLAPAESRSDYQATIVRGHRPNHILHLILSIITLGIWLIVWILVSAFGDETRKNHHRSPRRPRP